MQIGNVPQTLGKRAQVLYSLLRMRNFPDAIMHMVSNLAPLLHIEIIQKLHEHVANVKKSPETKMKIPEALEPPVRVQEPPSVMEKFPEMLRQMANILATLVQNGKFLLCLGKIAKVLEPLG